MNFQKLGLAPSSIKSLIGALIVKFSTSIISCWGSINLYILSYFHYQGTQITPTTNSFILLVSVPPMVLGMLFANRLCEKFGYQRVIRVSCIIFFLSPLMNLISFNLYMFCFFGITLPGAMFAMISVPVLNCIWTHFQNSKSKATAILVIAFGVGSMAWNMLFTHMINPSNEDTIDDHEKINFFSREVTKNVQKTTILGFFITGLLAILGSLLIQRKKVVQMQLKQQSLNLPEDIRTSSDGQLANSARQIQITIKQAVWDERFIIIMTISFLTGLYEIFLALNFKIIFMPLVNDDHFLSYMAMLGSFVGIFGAFIWGYLGDHKGVIWSILVLSILDFFGKIFSDFSVTKPTISLMIVLIGLISRSMTTLAGPGFVQLFGLKIGSQLLQFKGIAILSGYVIVPLFQILTANILTPRQYLICISFLSIITMICAIRLYWICEILKNNAKMQKFNNKEEIKQSGSEGGDGGGQVQKVNHSDEKESESSRQEKTSKDASRQNEIKIKYQGQKYKRYEPTDQFS